MLNKRAQLSDAMTWIIATLAIIIILVIFVFASQVIAKAKEISSLKSIEGGSSNLEVDLIEKKNAFAFEKNKNNELKIKEWLNENE